MEGRIPEGRLTFEGRLSQKEDRPLKEALEGRQTFEERLSQKGDRPLKEALEGRQALEAEREPRRGSAADKIVTLTA